MSVYVIDSNFFIEAHRTSYPLDVASSFWNKVKQLADDGKIISIDKVEKEIYKNEDALKQWCVANLPRGFFVDSSVVMNEYGQVAAWSASRIPPYLPNALAEFLDADEADSHLVAYVLADTTNRVVVTQEKSEPNKINKGKIPDACMALQVRRVNVIDMFRELNERF